LERERGKSREEEKEKRLSGRAVKCPWIALFDNEEESGGGGGGKVGGTCVYVCIYIHIKHTSIIYTYLFI
jgi:hypothetical protein